MAITKAINRKTKSHGAMRNCIEYVLRESKIKDGLVYITGPYAEDEITYDKVYRAYLAEKRLWNKDSGRMYTHHVISFHKDEKINPEQALEYGKEFADKWFDGFQCLVSVHQDKNHLHIHFVTNSVSFIDGKKIHASAKDLERMKELTNDMCRARGLTVAEKGKHFDGTPIEEGQITTWSQDKYKLMKEDPAKSFMVDCMKAINKIISECKDRLEFISKMKTAGWDVNWKDGRKNITFTNEKGEKVRDSNLSKTFHEDISKESLEKQFAINAEREKYYDEVAAEIESDNHSGGGRKSVLADLKKKKEEVKKPPVNKKHRIKQMEL